MNIFGNKYKTDDLNRKMLKAASICLKTACFRKATLPFADVFSHCFASASASLPLRWCSGWSVCFAVRRPGVHFPSRVIPKDLKNGIHSFPAWRSAHRDSVENKPASLLVVSLGKAFNGMPLSSCGRQIAAKQSIGRGGPV